MPRRRHLVAALADPGFRRLFTVRLAGQFGDGVFQASLAGAVLFNPEQQASAADVAAGFAALLLPYSLIGPFAGVLLDRWRRRNTLALGNLVRVALGLLFALFVAGGLHGPGFYAGALVLVAVARFLLAALSAALPRVVPPDEIVTANAFSTTAGTVAAAAGGAVAIGVRSLIGAGNADYGVIVAAATVAWLVAAAAASGFGRDALGPDDRERAARESLAAVARGLRAGVRHVAQRPEVRDALLMITVHRLCYGVTTVCTVLLYRNRFEAEGVFRAGLAGLGQIVAAVAAGGALAALLTPAAYRALGAIRWPAALLLGAAVVQATLVLSYRLPLVLLAALLLGFVAQAIKISVDTVVQRQVDDAFRGRVFSLYDTLFNVTLVVAAVLTATVLPEDGHSPVAVVVIAVGYALIAAVYVRAGRTRVAAHTQQQT